MGVSNFDGLNPRARRVFGRDVWDLEAREVAQLYAERGIIPNGSIATLIEPVDEPVDTRPKLRLIKGDGAPDDGDS